MTPVERQMDVLVRQAVQQGDVAVLEPLRATLRAAKDRYSAIMLDRFEKTLEYEIGMSAIRKLAALVKSSGDSQLAAEFMVLLHTTATRWQSAAAESQKQVKNRKAVLSRWEAQSNAIRYEAGITKARKLMALGHDSEYILDTLHGEKTKKNKRARANFARILRTAKALPATRRRRTS